MKFTNATAVAGLGPAYPPGTNSTFVRKNGSLANAAACCPFNHDINVLPTEIVHGAAQAERLGPARNKAFDGNMFDARLMDPQTLQKPYALYSNLGNCKPVFWSNAMSRWLVTTHQHVKEVLKDTDRFSSQVGVEMFPREHWLMMRPVAGELSKMMIFSDGESHRGLRCMMRQVFDGGFMKSLTPLIQNKAEQLLGELPRRCEILSAYSERIPVEVIAHTLGLPTKDVPKLHKLATQWVNATAVYGNRVALLRGLRAMWSLHRYFTKHNELKRHSPGDDLLSRLVDLQSKYGFSDDVLVAQAILLFVTGHETVQSTIASGCYLLSRHPDVVQDTISKSTSWKPIVEEILRFESPAQATMRIATQDTEIAGVAIRKGDSVVAGLAAANRDPKVFDQPDTFIPDRKPNRHLAFGFSNHACPAAMLGREEIRVGLSMLFERYPNLKVDCTPRWTSRHNFRTVVELPATLW